MVATIINDCAGGTARIVTIGPLNREVRRFFSCGWLGIG